MGFDFRKFFVGLARGYDNFWRGIWLREYPWWRSWVDSYLSWSTLDVSNWYIAWEMSRSSSGSQTRLKKVWKMSSSWWQGIASWEGRGHLIPIYIYIACYSAKYPGHIYQNFRDHQSILDDKIIWLVVEPTHLKSMLVKLDHFPRDRGENKKCFETTTCFTWKLFWGTLRIPRKDWWALGNIREDYGNHHPPRNGGEQSVSFVKNSIRPRGRPVLKASYRITQPCTTR